MRFALALASLAALLALASVPAAVVRAASSIELEAHAEGGAFFFTLAGASAKNPTLKVDPGADVTIHVVNKGSGLHNLAFDAPVSQKIPSLLDVGQDATLTIKAPSGDASVAYYCEPHRGSGMLGVLQIGAGGKVASGGSGLPDLSSFQPGGKAFAASLAIVIALGLGIAFIVGGRKPGATKAGAATDDEDL